MNKTRWFALIVALLVAGTYYFEFYKVAQEEKQKNTEAQILPFPAEQVHQVALMNDKGKLLLKRNADGWRIEEPIQDWADNQFTEDFVTSLAGEKIIETAAEGDDVDWARYSLDKPQATVQFTNQQNKTVSVEVSAKKNFEGNVFLRRDGENKVLVSGSQWQLRGSKSILDFRDKRLFRGKIGGVDEIGVRSRNDQFKLIQKDGKWIAEKHPDMKLDQNKVRELLTSVSQANAKNFLENLPDGKPVGLLTFKMGDKAWSAQFFEGKDKLVYATVSEPKFNLHMESGVTEKILDLTLLSLRDRFEPFNFDKTAVQHIEIKTKLKSMTLKKSQDTWKIEGSQGPVDSAKVRTSLDRLRETAATEFLNANESKNFKNPENQLVLKDAHQKVLFEITWGPTTAIKKEVGEKTLVLAKTNLFPSVFGLDQTVIDSWDLPAILK